MKFYSNLPNLLKANKAYIIIFLVILIAIGWYYSDNMFNNNEEILITVERGQISRELFETGTVKRGDNINLSFPVSGVISQLNVKVGDSVSAGNVLAELNKNDLLIRIRQAETNYLIANTRLEQLLTGLRPTEIEIYQANVRTAESSLANARNSLQDAENSLATAWREAFNKTDDAIRNNTDRFFKSPRTIGAVIDVPVADQNLRSSIGLLRIKVEKNLEEWGDAVLVEKILEEEVSIAVENLKTIEEFLKLTADAVNDLRSDIHYVDGRLTGAEIKTLTSTARNLVSSSISSLQNNNELYRLARGNVNLAENDLERTRKELSLALQGAREEEIKIAEAEVLSIKSNIDLLKKQFNDATLRASQRGKIIEVNKRSGENVSPGESVITLSPDTPFEIEVDVYEGEISLVEIGALVDINLVAFPNDSLAGVVSSIEPAGRVIDGVVYYRATVQAQTDWPIGLRQGMTADLTIRVDEQENSLIVPYRALNREDGVYKVLIKSNGQIEDRSVTIGIRDSAGQVEILSGLEEGEFIISP